MVSDGGGGSGFPFEWVPVVAAVVAVIAVVINVWFTVTNWRRADRREARDAVVSALAHVLSTEVVAARDVVAQAARRGQGLRGTFPTYEDMQKAWAEEREFSERTRRACFTLMWTIQAIHPQIVRHLRGSIVRTPEAESLYWHLNQMSSQLSRALERWGSRFSWESAGEQTAAALASMPVVKGQMLDLTVRSSEEQLRAVLDAFDRRRSKASTSTDVGPPDDTAVDEHPEADEKGSSE